MDIGLVENKFLWSFNIQRRFLESIHGDYDIATLDYLKQKIAEEMEKVKFKHHLKRAELLQQCIEYFYIHFCRLWNFHKQVYTFVFSADMQSTWAFVLSNLIKLCLILSKGCTISRWTHKAIISIGRFPGRVDLVYDALLSIKNVKNKYKPAYCAVLKSVMEVTPFWNISNPAKFLKMNLLMRRLSQWMEDGLDKVSLLMRARNTAPPSLSDWLSENGFYVNWRRKGVTTVDLLTNICERVEGTRSQVKILKDLRKILLPIFDIDWKKQKSRYLEENLQCRTEQADPASLEGSSESVKNASEEIKVQKLEGIARKVLNDANQVSSLMEDSSECIEQNAHGLSDCMDDKDSDEEPKSKRRKKIENIAAEKDPDNMNVIYSDSSLPEDISHGAIITKRQEYLRKRTKKWGGNSSETGVIAVDVQYEADSSVIVDENYGNENAPNERERPFNRLVLNSDSICVDSSEKHPGDTEIIENNALDSVKSELPFKNTVLSCEVKTEEITQGHRVVESPIHNNSCFKTGEISPQSMAETASPESVDISSSERKNLENNCIVNIKSEAPFENSASSLQENTSLQFVSMNTNCSSQATIIKEEKSTSEQIMSDVVSDSSQFVSINTNNYSQEHVIKEKSTSDTSLPEQIRSEVVSDSGISCSTDVYNFEVKEEKNNTNEDVQGPSQNNTINDQPEYHVSGSSFDVKSPFIKTEVCLPEDSKILPNCQITDDFATQNLKGESKSNNVETPNTSAAKSIIENMLKLAESAGCRKESLGQNTNKGDLISTLNGLSETFLSKLTSAANEKPADCLSFLDVSTESAGSQNDSHNFASHMPESAEFLEYRDLSNDQGDNRSEDALSDVKSILKTDVSEYPSDSSDDTEDENNPSSQEDCNSPASSPGASNLQNRCETYVVKTELSWEGNITKQQFGAAKVDNSDDDWDSSSQEDETENHEAHVAKTESSLNDSISGKQSCNDNVDGCDTKSSHYNATATPLKTWMLDPVVYLGERCDSKSKVDTNSVVSVDSFSIPITAFAQPNIKVEEEETEKAITIDQFSTLVSERIIKIEATQHSSSDTGKHSENGIINCEVKIDTQPDKKLAVSGLEQESVEIREKQCVNDAKLIIGDEHQESLEVIREKILPDHNITECDKGQELTETEKEKQLSLDIKLKKKPVTASPTEKSSNTGNFIPDVEGSSVLNQDTSSYEEKSTPADDGSSVSANRRRNQRNRNPSTSSNHKVIKRRSETVTKRSSKRLKKEVNLNLDLHFSDLSLNSPRALRSKPNGSSIKNSSEVVQEKPSTIDFGSPLRRLTRASAISSTANTRTQKKDMDSEGYNLRSRRSVIMPSKLKL